MGAGLHSHWSTTPSNRKTLNQTPTSVLLGVVVRLLTVHRQWRRQVVSARRPRLHRLPAAGPTHSPFLLPCPNHERCVGPAHRQQGSVVVGPAEVGHLGAVSQVALEAGILTL